MGFQYEDEELELNYKGESHKFRAPSAYEQKQLSDTFKNADESTDAVTIYVDFFVSLGLPKEIVSKMSMKGLLGLFEYAVGSKKN